MLRTICLISAIAWGSGASAVTLSNALPSGTQVDLSGLTTNTPLASNDPAFTAAGIASITVDGRASGNNEFYDGGATFGAGRALFGLESGDLIALDEGVSPDFGSPAFTIVFEGIVDAFGFRLADTSSSFVLPVVTFFLNNLEIDAITLNGSYTAQTEFGFTDPTGFDRVVISTASSDGYGITDLTVGGRIDTAPVPVPAALPLLLSGIALLAGLRRRG